MSSAERPMGAAKGKQPNPEALCQPPPPPCAKTWVSSGAGSKGVRTINS